MISKPPQNPMDKDNQKLNESYLYCHDVAKKNSNFYLGMILTSKEKSKAFLAIYTWMHIVDDIADNTDETPGVRLDKLQQYYERTLEILNQPSSLNSHEFNEKYWPAFRKTVLDYDIPISCLEDMVAGQKQDLVKNNYQHFTDLYEYCRLVASTIGIISITIWGYKKDVPDVKLLAERCGVAFQLTNILRDMIEDIKLNRVYLPAEFVGVEKLTTHNFSKIPQDNILSGINKIIELTDDYYNKSSKLYYYLNNDGRLSFLILCSLYKTLFNKIRANPAIILEGKRIRLNKIKKIQVLLFAICTHFFRKLKAILQGRSEEY